MTLKKAKKTAPKKAAKQSEAKKPAAKKALPKSAAKAAAKKAPKKSKSAGRGSAKAGKRADTPVKLTFMPEKGAPIVHLELALINGSLRDPQGKDGVASLTLSMLLRGTRRRPAKEFHRALDGLGAEISLGKYKESMRIYGTVLADKLPEFMDLLDEALTEPAFDEAEFKKLKEQLHSSFKDELGSDDDIADRRFQEQLLWGNPYGRMTAGSLETLPNLQLEDLRAFHQAYFRRGDFVLGASGSFDQKFLERRLKEILAKLPEGSAGRLEAPAPSFKAARTLLLLDKPGRTQGQIIVGAPGVCFDDKDYFAMLIANHVFGGGSFSARLMKEVREKRGWSYGAYSFYRSGRKPLYFAMQSTPSNKDTIPALNLMVELLEDYAKNGITKAEFDFAKKSLVNQSAFLQDTVRKRLDNKITEEVLKLPKGFYDKYRDRLMGLTHAQVQSAIKRKVDPTRLFAVILGDADALKADVATLKGYNTIWKRKFDEAPVDLATVSPLILSPGSEARKEISKRKR